MGAEGPRVTRGSTRPRAVIVLIPRATMSRIARFGSPLDGDLGAVPTSVLPVTCCANIPL